MLETYLDWTVGTALPFWAERGFDAGAGRFRERLDFAGQPVAVPHRAMVQARQIFVFAEAARFGWLPEGASLAETAMAALLRDFAEDSGDETSVAFSIDPASGAIVSGMRDAYAHAFLLFSIASLYRLNGDARLLDRADRIINFVERRLADPVHGGLFDALPAPAEKRQNPHMHLLEAYLFLDEAAPGRGYIARATALVDLFRRCFFQDGLLHEYFAPDWSPSPRAEWEPGHHFEWVWLLAEYGARAGDDVSGSAAALYASARRHGIAADGLILDALSPDFAIVRSSRRLWPHAEAIKAAAARKDNDPDARAFAEVMATRLMDHFLGQPFAGGWVDHIAADGAPLVDYVPASSLYHLVLAAGVAAKDFAAAPALAKAVS
jgi:mannose/cellobiose epimerase-like protein (N-acyl-D-glucosamine 2-epimerase family)